MTARVTLECGYEFTDLHDYTVVKADVGRKLTCPSCQCSMRIIRVEATDFRDVFQYSIGQHLIFHTHHGTEWPVEVIAHTALPCCMIIKWHGLQPLTTGDKSTVCLKDLANVTIDERDWTVKP